MKEIKMVKKLFVLIMCVGLILAFSKFVYAADEDPFFEITAENTSSNETATESNNATTNEENNTVSNTDLSNSLFTNTENTNTNNATLTTNDNTTNNTNSYNNFTNRSVTDNDTLAKTGLSDSKGMLTLIVVLCGISAIYSYKKINDYKKL